MKKSICFSGNRVEKIKSFSGKYFDSFSEIIKSILYIKAINFIDKDFTKFYIGMSNGIDLWIGQTLIELKDTQYPELEIIAVRPFLSHGSNFSVKDKIIYKNIVNNVSKIVCINDIPNRNSYLVRNKYMVDNSNKLCALAFDLTSGTGFTLDYAKKTNKPFEFINLQELLQDYIQSIETNSSFYEVKKFI